MYIIIYYQVHNQIVAVTNIHTCVYEATIDVHDAKITLYICIYMCCLYVYMCIRQCSDTLSQIVPVIGHYI